MHIDGLSTIQYETLKIRFKPLYTHIYVTYNQKNLTKDFDHLTVTTKTTSTTTTSSLLNEGLGNLNNTLNQMPILFDLSPQPVLNDPIDNILNGQLEN
jgi:hypothetical protein